MIRTSVGVALAAILAACSPQSDTPSTPVGPAQPGMGAGTIADFKTALPLKEVMAHVIDYNAFGVWNNQGWLIDAAGMHELFPTDDAGWHAAESAAISLAEASNVLLLPGRPRDEDRRWVDYSHALYDAAMKAHDMAEKRDKQGFFDAGGDMYEACVQCHNHYIIGDQGGPDATLPPLPNRTAPTQ